MPTRAENFTIERTLPSERLDTFLRARFPALSRGAIQRLIEQGHIRVNGRTVKPTHTPHAGEQVEVRWPEARPAEAQPEEMALDILHEDDALRRITLSSAVGRLEERDRELIALRYGADLTARQIAELQGAKTNAVEVALHRALGRLRTHLESEAEPPVRKSQAGR